MSRSSQLTLPELNRALGRLAGYVGKHHEWSSDNGQYVREGLRSIISHLQYFIPGLDQPLDRDLAHSFLESAQQTLRQGQNRTALFCTLHGLGFAPLDARLWYIGATAAYELGEAELAVLMLQQTLWINPGYRDARADLEALMAFLEGGGEETS